MTECIQVYPDIIPKELCEQFQHVIDSSMEAKSSAVTTYDADWRKCYQISFPDAHFDTLKSYMNQALSKYKDDLPDFSCTLNFTTQLEKPTIIKYSTEEGHKFNMHADNFNVGSAARQISVIIYLNDVKEGGETIFPHHNVSIPPKAGSVALFPSHWTYPHLGVEPKSEAKYIIVTWYCYEGPGPFFYRI